MKKIAIIMTMLLTGCAHTESHHPRDQQLDGFLEQMRFPGGGIPACEPILALDDGSTRFLYSMDRSLCLQLLKNIGRYMRIDFTPEQSLRGGDTYLRIDKFVIKEGGQ